MRNLNLRYVDEEYDEKGILKHVEYHYPDNYNFGYDVVDEIAREEPDRLAMIWTNPEGEERRFTFGDMKRMSDKTANYLLSAGI
jgi:acetyl-CoA synthetase